MLNSLKEHVIDRIWKLSKATGNPIYVIIDDTISEKTVPSSKAKETTEKCDFYRSHLNNKTVYGHQLVTAMLRCGNIVLPYAIVIYDKTSMSKIEIATNIIKSLPKPIKEGYVLCDSWSLFDASKARGYTYIGALKANRVIYPKSHEKLGIKVHEFAKALSVKDVSLVTANNHEYYVYTYKGKLSDLNEAVIVLSLPKEALFNKSPLKAFISLDTDMDAEAILNHYVYRCPIEIFFRESKRYLGLDDYQVRTEKSAKRFLILLMLTYVYCGLEISGKTLDFSKGLKVARKEVEQSQVAWIYKQALSGVSLDQVFKTLKVA